MPGSYVSIAHSLMLVTGNIGFIIVLGIIDCGGGAGWECGLPSSEA